jgi:hypothetical protein
MATCLLHGISGPKGSERPCVSRVGLFLKIPKIEISCFGDVNLNDEHFCG